MDLPRQCGSNQKLFHLRPLRQRERGYLPATLAEPATKCGSGSRRAQLLWKLPAIMDGYIGSLAWCSFCRVALTGFTQPQASCNAQRPRVQ